MNTAPQMGAITTGGASGRPGSPGRTLPPAVWDRLKATADAVGGIAPGRLFEADSDMRFVDYGKDANGLLQQAIGEECPVCLVGVAASCGLVTGKTRSDLLQSARGLFGPFTDFFILDDAIQAAGGVREFTGRKLRRVPFESVMAQLGITRGEEASNA